MPTSTTHNTDPPATGRYAVVDEEGVSRTWWNGQLEGSPGGGHLFQSYEWGEFKRTLGWNPVRVTLQKDGEVAGLGQFLTYRTPLVPGVLMYCPKGPWLPWEDEEAVRAFFGGLLAVATRWGAHTVKIEPEVPESQARVKEVLSEIGFHRFRWNVNHKTTMVVDLGRSEEELLAGMKRTPRYNVRLAAKKGVRVVEDNSEEAIKLFWRMHGETVERKNFWSRSYGYYSALWRAMREAGRGHLFWAEHEGDRLAAAIFLNFGRKCIYMLATSTVKKRNLKPNYLLQWEVMKWAKRRGITHYDTWGIPTPDKLNEDHPLYGVYKFKEGFGAEMADFLGCLDLPVRGTRAKLWDKVEPVYFRLHQRLKGDVYY